MFLTERLLLRPSKPTDKEMVLGLYNSLASGPWIASASGFLTPKPESFFEKALSIWAVLFIVEERDAPDVAIGMLGCPGKLDRRSNRCWLGIGLLEQYWSKGYGTEMMHFILDYSFRILGFRRVELQVFGRNDRALALYKKIGFVTEGKQRKVRCWEDGWEDLVMMAITKEEWKKDQQLGVPANS